LRAMLSPLAPEPEPLTLMELPDEVNPWPCPPRIRISGV